MGLCLVILFYQITFFKIKRQRYLESEEQRERQNRELLFLIHSLRVQNPWGWAGAEARSQRHGLISPLEDRTSIMTTTKSFHVSIACGPIWDIFNFGFISLFVYRVLHVSYV